MLKAVNSASMVEVAMIDWSLDVYKIGDFHDETSSSLAYRDPGHRPPAKSASTNTSVVKRDPKFVGWRRSPLSSVSFRYCSILSRACSSLM
jgi:hypothetical protein